MQRPFRAAKSASRSVTEAYPHDGDFRIRATWRYGPEGRRPGSHPTDRRPMVMTSPRTDCGAQERAFDPQPVDQGIARQIASARVWPGGTSRGMLSLRRCRDVADRQVGGFVHRQKVGIRCAPCACIPPPAHGPRIQDRRAQRGGDEGRQPLLRAAPRPLPARPFPCRSSRP